MYGLRFVETVQTNLNLWGCGYLKNGRPDFRDIKSFEEFSRYYWYREELSKICKSLGLEYRSTVNGK